MPKVISRARSAAALSGSLLPVLVSPAGGVPRSRTTNSVASRVAQSTTAGIPWGSAASTRFAGSGSGF